MNNSIYKLLVDSVDQGCKFKIDLKDKNLWIGKTQLIAEGFCDKENDFIQIDDLFSEGFDANLNDDPWNWIEVLYEEYKHSVPGEHNNQNQSYFKGLSSDELTDNELAFNISRDLGQAILEGYILCASLQGWLKWNNENHWFWQGKDKDLVILKDWI